MFKTSLSHAAITVVVSMIAWALGSLAIGITLALGFYLGREVAQHERKTPGTNPLRGTLFWNWSLDAVLDLVLPILAAASLYFAVQYLLR